MASKYSFCRNGEDIIKEIRYAEGIPDKGGQKDYAPDGSWLDAKRLETFYRERRDVLSHERVRCMSSVVNAEWIPEERRVLLCRNGKFNKSMGYTDNRKDYLLPEEALFLLDEGAIYVSYKGLPLSIEEAYAVFLTDTGVTFDQYQVFAHFTRLGYTLRRYQGPSDVTEYEKKLKIKQRGKNKKKRKHDPSKAGPSSEADSVDPAAKRQKVDVVDSAKSEETLLNPTGNERLTGEDLHIKPNSDLTTNSGDPGPFIKQDPQADGDRITSLNNKAQRNGAKGLTSMETRNMDSEDFRTLSSNVANSECMDIECSEMTKNEPGATDSMEKTGSVSNITSTENILCSKFTAWNFEEITFPDISQQRGNKVRCAHKSQSVLPNSIKSCDKEYEVKVRSTGTSQSTELVFSQGLAGVKANLKASNWREYKAKLAAMSSADILVTSPVGYLWKDNDVTPLIQPKDACNTASVQKKLKVIENVNLSLPKKSAKNCDEDLVKGAKSTELRILYDGYRPNSNFVKTNPGTPQFRLAVVNSYDPVPDLDKLSRMTSESAQDSVPLIWAVVQCGDISFFSFCGVDIPNDIPLG